MSAESPELRAILDEYATLLQRVDQWFSHCLSVVPKGTIHCTKGCSDCCRGLFDITLLDACLLRHGFEQLPLPTQKAVLDSVEGRLQSIRAVWPDFTYPYLLNYRDEEEWDDVMPEEDETPCVLLDGEGRCLVYEFRPMTCRLNGIPMVDVSGEEFFDEWCTRNFTDIDPLMLPELRSGFRRLFADELELFRRFTLILCGERISEMDTLIPTALLIDFSRR